MDRKCPRCGGSVYRTKRRTVDHLLSLVRPVQRYQCIALECAWVGNLPRDPLPRTRYFEPLDTPSILR
jgi:hypothetical protein